MSHTYKDDTSWLCLPSVVSRSAYHRDFDHYFKLAFVHDALQDAARHFARSLAVCQASGDSHGEAAALWWQGKLPVQAGAANIYTECARIWNPIHSDKAFALAAGLPNIILHGTATLALAVSKLVDEHLDGDPTRVVRIGGRFTGMVLMPTVLCLQLQWQSKDYLGFGITDGQGAEVFSQGFVGFR